MPDSTLLTSTTAEFESTALPPESALPPVAGVDDRSRLPRDLFERQPGHFLARFGLALILTAGCIVFVVYTKSMILTGIGLFVLGMFYGHLVEFQHECLHGHAFRSKQLNKWLGRISGMFFLSSYTHYKVEHLRHHATLGTAANTEFFDYRFSNLNSLRGFFFGAYSMARYPRIFKYMWQALRGKPFTCANQISDQKDIRNEYLQYGALIAAAVGLSIFFHTWIVAELWVLPLLLSGEATHFLIELPEHYGLNTQKLPDVLSNTRTIGGSALSRWFTNWNNYHTAHHYHPGVPMVKVSKLNSLIQPKVQVYARSYTGFYRSVIQGKIHHDASISCMKR
jgi:fatty acid desaturase